MANEANDVGISIEAYRYPTLHCDNLSTKRGHGAVGSAFEWHSKGQGFESPWLHQKNIVHFVRYFLFEDRGFHDFIVMLLCNTNPCGLPASKERRKRNAFAEIVRSGHSKQTRHGVSRVLCAVVRQHRLFSVDASLCK